MQQANTRPWQSKVWFLIIGFLLAGAAHSEDRETDGMKTIVGTSGTGSACCSRPKPRFL